MRTLNSVQARYMYLFKRARYYVYFIPTVYVNTYSMIQTCPQRNQNQRFLFSSLKLPRNTRLILDINEQRSFPTEIINIHTSNLFHCRGNVVNIAL